MARSRFLNGKGDAFATSVPVRLPTGRMVQRFPDAKGAQAGRCMAAAFRLHKRLTARQYDPRRKASSTRNTGAMHDRLHAPTTFLVHRPLGPAPCEAACVSGSTQTR